ncbi:Crp/Fnr family transcriptional regulator [Corynebacterium humireducens]|nr:Crp/Fnr family transcriptional regulator [Corynebacterium humireducens]
MSTNPVRPSCARPHSCSLDVRLTAMSRSPLTRDLGPEEHLDLDGHLTAWSWAEGDPVFLAGEEVTGSYLVVSGRVRVTRDTIDGKEITVDIAAPGDVIGPLDIRASEAVDSAWAMETTCALHLPAEALAEVVEKHPKLALAIIRMQQDRLAQSRERDIAQATKTVEQRVAKVLRRLNGKLGQLQADGSSLLQVRLRRDDIAGMAGTTLESASRAMSKMKKSGIIDSGREWVAIADPDALDTLIGEE